MAPNTDLSSQGSGSALCMVQYFAVYLILCISGCSQGTTSSPQQQQQQQQQQKQIKDSCEVSNYYFALVDISW